jgi:hypothetical protein
MERIGRRMKEVRNAGIRLLAAGFTLRLPADTPSAA